MDSTTYLKNIKTTPKKLRFLLGAIKKLKPSAALDYLMYTPNKAGRIYYKALHSAIANAKNTLKVSDDLLKFKVFTVEQGQKMKRYRPNARGTVRPFIKRYSHIKIVLTAAEGQPAAKPATAEKPQAKVEAPVEKKEVKATPKKTESKEVKTEKKEAKSKVTNTKK